MNDVRHDPLITTLQTLADLTGVSGDETKVRRAIKPLVENHVDTLRVDALGNLITYKRGTAENPLRVLVTAHMDEVGFMVTGHTGEGGLRVAAVGSIPERLLPGTHVWVGQEPLAGVIGLQAIHRLHGESFPQAAPIEDLVVDIGAKNKEEAQEAAPLGTVITFATRCREMGAVLTGKAFDDRAGCAILVALLQGERLPCDLYGVFTVQEEVGLRGARVAAYAVEPDVGFVLEGTLVDDLPKHEKDVSPTTELGKGPAITVMDRSYITPPRLLSHVLKTAAVESIPCQLKQPGISGTEAGGIHPARGGVPAITIAVPCRYIHSPRAVLHPNDLANTLRLVRASIARLTPETLAFT
ncbi:MAG TPA: M42 family peptidase [Anaerolineae bacterium]|nr:M42 family peptidase [Anaerolineae bacterium]HQH38947.1 M42 family peptidase [Anaerolineae bacterium]